jgi:hypothetical protein
LEKEVAKNENAAHLQEAKLQDEVDAYERLAVIKVALDNDNSSV